MKITMFASHFRGSIKYLQSNLFVPCFTIRTSVEGFITATTFNELHTMLHHVNQIFVGSKHNKKMSTVIICLREHVFARISIFFMRRSSDINLHLLTFSLFAFLHICSLARTKHPLRVHQPKAQLEKPNFLWSVYCKALNHPRPLVWPKLLFIPVLHHHNIVDVYSIQKIYEVHSEADIQVTQGATPIQLYQVNKC